MKKILIGLFVVLAILFRESIPARSAAADAAADAKKLRIVTTIFAPYDFTRVITGGNADVSMLLPPGSESHSYEPTPRDIIKIQNCDVFIYVGGGSDEWMRGVLSSMNTDNMTIITLMDCVEPVEEEIIEGMQPDDESNGENEPEYDEHVWTSPRNAKLIVQRIADTLCVLDEARADAYQTNASAYLEQLDELDAAFADIAQRAVRKTIVFADRFPFRYFADAYGLSCYAAFPGCSTETEASAATIKFLIDKIKAESIPVVFHIELSNERMADTLCEATGAKKLLLHAVHNITKTDFENGLGYIDLMKINAENLKEALN